MVTQINRTSKVPLYHQLYEIFTERIDSGYWKPGEMIPPESELGDQYQVSRMTIRQVLDMLVNEGRIYRERGRGTFISHLTMEQAMVQIISFTEDMQRRGFNPGTKVLSAELMKADKELASKLDINQGEELARIKRLRLADGEPMSIEESYLVHSYCPGILGHDFARNSLRITLDQGYGIKLTHAKQVIKAMMPMPDLINILKLEKNIALLYIERTSYSQYNIPAEFLRLYNRGDRYHLYNDLRG
jgi:GntR family transcriptional regulator